MNEPLLITPLTSEELDPELLPIFIKEFQKLQISICPNLPTSELPVSPGFEEFVYNLVMLSLYNTCHKLDPSKPDYGLEFLIIPTIPYDLIFGNPSN